jgi:hypothetical protein
MPHPFAAIVVKGWGIALGGVAAVEGCFVSCKL